MTLASAVRDGLTELGELDPRDRAVAELAMRYAESIDDDRDWGDVQRDPLAELGPKLLAALKELGMTPAARKALVADPAPAVKRESKLDELRRRRAARVSS